MRHASATARLSEKKRGEKLAMKQPPKCEPSKTIPINVIAFESRYLFKGLIEFQLRLLMGATLLTKDKHCVFISMKLVSIVVWRWKQLAGSCSGSYRVEYTLHFVIMQRDIFRDGILLIFLCLFIYQVLLATRKVPGKEKAVKTRYVLEFNTSLLAGSSY